MRKLDTLIIKSFIGPFILTTVVATFILLIQYMMKYFDDFVGKNLGFEVFGELLFYFSLNMLQVALPLGVLVSSLMTFGNLGENFELTAIKGAGISLLRALRPIFFIVVVLTFLAFNFNNHIVPAANLKAYSLLYDIKHKKPGLDIKEGQFYNGIPDYNIKVKEKLPDGENMLDVLIYDHSEGRGNNRVILADSSRMYTILNEKYLKLELYRGNYYAEEFKPNTPVDQFYRTNFDRMEMVFSLSSFDLKRTKEELFQNNRQMKNIKELTTDIDSLEDAIVSAKVGFFTNSKGFFSYHLTDYESEKWRPKRKTTKDTVRRSKSMRPVKASMFPLFAQEDQTPVLNKDKNLQLRRSRIKMDSANLATIKDKFDTTKLVVPRGTSTSGSGYDSLTWDFLNGEVGTRPGEIVQSAKNQVQNIKVNLTSVTSRVDALNRDVSKWSIEKWKKYSQALACIVMFLIGAPLGAIIKKGGLGVPVIVSILFFLTYYVINITFEKWAKEGMMDPALSVFVADLVLLPIGLFFLRQARIDARLFDTDFYNVWIDKLKERFSKKMA